VYIYIRIRQFNKTLIKISKKALGTLRDDDEAGYEQQSSKD